MIANKSQFITPATVHSGYLATVRINFIVVYSNWSRLLNVCSRFFRLQHFLRSNQFDAIVNSKFIASMPLAIHNTDYFLWNV